MHSMAVLMQSLLVDAVKREWWIDLPELTTIRLGCNAFRFKDNDSTELVMRSGYSTVKWWLDLPKLTTLTTEREDSESFRRPHHIILESASSVSSLPSRHAFSRNSHSPSCFWRQEWCKNHWMSHFIVSLIRSCWLPWRVRLPSWILSQTIFLLYGVLLVFLQTNPSL